MVDGSTSCNQGRADEADCKGALLALVLARLVCTEDQKRESRTGKEGESGDAYGGDVAQMTEHVCLCQSFRKLLLSCCCRQLIRGGEWRQRLRGAAGHEASFGDAGSCGRARDGGSGCSSH